MKEKPVFGLKTTKPFKPTNFASCPVNYYKCEKCLYEDVAGCCPIGSSCMCSNDGRLSACETI